MHILLHRLCSSITYYLMQYCCQTNQTPYDHIGIDLFLATMRFDEKLSKFFMHFKFGKKISKIVKNFYCGFKTALSLFRNAYLVFKIINPSCFIYIFLEFQNCTICNQIFFFSSKTIPCLLHSFIKYIA